MFTPSLALWSFFFCGRLCLLFQLVRLYGDNARLYLLRCLVSEIDFSDVPAPGPGVFMPPKLTLLAEEIADMSTRPNSISILCKALESIPLPQDFFTQFAAALSLPLTPQVLIGLGLCHSGVFLIQEEAQKFLKHIIASFTSEANKASTEKLPPHVLHELVYWVRTAPVTAISSDLQKQQYLQAIGMAYPEIQKELAAQPLMNNTHGPSRTCSFVLSFFSLFSFLGGWLLDLSLCVPFPSSGFVFHLISFPIPFRLPCFAIPTANLKALFPEGTETEENSLRLSASISASCGPADVLQDIGAVCCSSLSNFREVLNQFAKVSEEEVAKMVAMIVRSHGKPVQASLPQTHVLAGTIGSGKVRE